MDILNYNQKIAVMRVLLDIIHADGRVNVRETNFFYKLLDELDLPKTSKDEISNKSSLIALLDIKNFTDEQKEQAKTITPGAPGSINISAAIHDNGVKQNFNGSCYIIRVPKGCWVEDDEDSWIEVSWDRFLFAGKTTKIQLDGVPFDENSAPKLHYSVLKKIENHRKGNVNVVNLITKPVSIPSGIKNNASKK